MPGTCPALSPPLTLMMPVTVEEAMPSHSPSLAFRGAKQGDLVGAREAAHPVFPCANKVS